MTSRPARASFCRGLFTRAAALMAVVVGLAACTTISLEAAPPRVFSGPFDYWDGITFYVVNPEDKPFTIRLESQSGPMLVRVFDPEETLLVRKGFPYDVENRSEHPIGTWRYSVPARGAGVYMVTVTGHKGKVDFNTEPGLAFGVLGHVNLLMGSGGQYDNAYVYLPPGLDELPVRAWRSDLTELTVRDGAGKLRLRLTGKDPSSVIKDLPKGAGHVWRLSVKSNRKYSLDFGLLPIILCPDEATARAIHASVDVLDDGTICYHKFQIRIHDILKRYRAMPKSTFDVPDYNPADHRDELLKESERNLLLFGHYGILATLPTVLHEQNLDPKSPWFGSTWQWHDGKGIEKSVNPMATYMRLTGRYQQMAWFANNMAAVYRLDAPFNPLHRNKALLNRVIVGSLQNMMLLKEGEFFSPADVGYHYGAHAFWLRFVMQPFEWTVRDCPPDVREVWTEALTRAVDRMSMLQVASTSNQWAFGMAAFQAFYEGTGDKRYADIRDRHIDWLLTGRFGNYGQTPAGYMTEGGGPDSTYNGLTGVHLAEIYGQTRDKSILESLDRAYTLFNHTVAPEPGNHWRGASSFSCRTPGDWTGAQGGGGHNIMGNDLASAGLWVGRSWLFYPTPQTPEQRARVRADRERIFHHHYRTYAPDMLRKQPENLARAQGAYGKYVEWMHFASRPKVGKLPMVAEDRFSRSFGDEFHAVRRKPYYALTYTGVKWPRWRGEADDLTKLFPSNGDLCLFWSPGFGTSVLGKNWSAYTAMSLIARHGDALLRDDYFALKHNWQDDPAQLTVTGTMRKLPIDFTRRYRFEEDALIVEVTLGANEAVTIERFDECFPHGHTKPPVTGKRSAADRVMTAVDLPDDVGPEDQPVPVDVMPVDLEAKKTDPRAAEAVVFSVAGNDEVHLLVFDRARGVDIGLNEGDRPWGRVLAGLPRSFVAKRYVTLRWALVPCSRHQMPETIRRLRKRLSEPDKEP